MTTRRRVAEVRRRIREEPDTVGDLLASAIAEDREVALTGAQVVALVWWVEARGEEASA
jgi:hypothetical protein